jgi:hypothetical protein
VVAFRWPVPVRLDDEYGPSDLKGSVQLGLVCNGSVK